MDNKRSDALTAVVFLTDGKPTVAWEEIKSDWIPGKGWVEDEPALSGWSGNNKDGYTWYNGYIIGTDGNGTHANWEKHGTTLESPRNVKKCLNAALNDVDDIQTDFMYLVGMGSADEDTLDTVKKSATGANSCEVLIRSYTEIEDAFTSIAEKLNSLFYTNVGVKDILRHSSGELVVDLVSDAKILVSVYDGDKLIAGPETKVTLLSTDNNGEANLTTNYNATTHQLDLIFPDDYKLEPTYTYKMSTIIKPTEKAYEMYRDSGYNDTGEQGTGSLSGKLGFYANDSATAYYNYSGIPNQGKPYAYPIVQLEPGELKVVKSFEGLTKKQIEALDMSFKVTIQYPKDTSNNNQADPVTYEFTLDKMVAEGDTFTWTIDKLSPNTEYTVTEIGGAVEGYDMTTKVNGEVANEDKSTSGTVPRGQTVTVSYENAYTVSVTNVKVEKQVTGNMGDVNKPFTFTASLSGKANSMAGVEYVKYSKGDNGALVAGTQTAINADTFEFTLKDDEYIIFYKVPVYAELTVSEVGDGYVLESVNVTKLPQGKTATVNDKAVTLTVTALPDTESGVGHELTFTNNKNVSIDTGIALDSLPYVIILLGVMTAAGFLFLRRRRSFED